MEAYGHLMKLQPSATSTVDTKGLREKCFEAMNDDLNSPIVISHLFDAAPCDQFRKKTVRLLCPRKT